MGANPINRLDPLGLWDVKWLPFLGTIVSIIETHAGWLAGAHKGYYVGCSNFMPDQCEACVKDKASMYYLNAVTPTVVKLVADYIVTAAATYARIPVIAIPAKIISAIDTLTSLYYVPLAGEKIKKARDEAIEEYCKECPKK